MTLTIVCITVVIIAEPPGDPTTKNGLLFLRTIVGVIEERGLFLGANAFASSLSGGNLQKFVVGREIGQKPSLFIVNQPTWGVDALSAANIRQAIVDIANTGAAIILISQDLDEILEISNKVAFLTNGKLSIPTNTMDIKTDEIGAIMGGISD